MNEPIAASVARIAEELATALENAESSLAAAQPMEAERTVRAGLDRAIAALESLGWVGPENRLPSGILWERCASWLSRGELQTRARTKPRGYAGDDVMLRQIAANYVSPADALGQIQDRYFQSQTAPQAVRNRLNMVGDAIAAEVGARGAGAVRVVSVGSGPALDLQRGAESVLPKARARLRLTLLDLDPLALEAAVDLLAASGLAGEQIRAERVNLNRLARLAIASELLSADLSVCTGFFDYLSDSDAAALLAAMWRHLRPGGRLLAFNFAPHNPSRGYMEWIGNWYLTYRTREQCRALALAAGLPENAFTLGAEALGIDLFIDARKGK